ncbi:RNA/RNP complex-1-interacting phosphatase [Labeo rohita]|uniref:RNA/RNP complex-1-interacting phosphatase n=1 Tax=Labeo rohita TaxID=84645 RepID=A0ABQ8M9M0_LABRO|nr:RNA/RNP complex-1-interacting phosphatase [Labeo rohita]
MPAKKKNAVPDRWTDYTPLGKRIPGTRFIAFKVPLKQSFRYHLTQSEAFGPFDLVGMLEKEGQELGLIIDLTFTTRYYKVEDLPNTLYHLKIFTAGHEVPNDATILSFKKANVDIRITFNNNFACSNEGMEEPDQEPTQGLANEPRDDAPPHHRREQHNHDPPLNGQGPHQWHREPQNQFLPFQQKNIMTWFGPPEPQFFRPPLIPHPPQEMRPVGPCFPNQGVRGFHFGHYPPPLPSYRFGEPYHKPRAPPEGFTRPPGSHRKHRYRHRRGPHDRTPR